jgi:transcription elongation factor Elf1
VNNKDNDIKVLAVDIYINNENSLKLKCVNCGSWDSITQKLRFRNKLLVKCNSCGFKIKLPLRKGYNKVDYVRFNADFVNNEMKEIKNETRNKNNSI